MVMIQPVRLAGLRCDTQLNMSHSLAPLQQGHVSLPNMEQL